MERDDYNYYNDEMAVVASNCKGFVRNGDTNYFSMETYKSCENCRNFTTDYRCRLNRSGDILFNMNWK